MLHFLHFSAPITNNYTHHGVFQRLLQMFLFDLLAGWPVLGFSAQTIAGFGIIGEISRAWLCRRKPDCGNQILVGRGCPSPPPPLLKAPKLPCAR